MQIRPQALALLLLGGAGAAETSPPPFPSLEPAAWIGAPRSWESLRGKVVVLDVWTFGCVNCVRTLPWLKGVHERYGPRGVVVVGVHSPEFGFERQRGAIEAEVRRHGLDFSNYLDLDLAYWKALDNQYWPTTYLVDKCGRIRDRHIGEIHAGRASGNDVEAAIESLLRELPGCP